jgi:hypothetical protein
MTFHVFISHKSQDESIAASIGAILLRNLAADQVTVFVSERTEFDDDYRSRIKDELAKANWLLLIYTGADKDWGWCSYEVGIYDGLHHTAICAQLQNQVGKSSPRSAELERRVICLHHRNQPPPSTIDNRQTVKMIPDRVRALIKRYYSLVEPHELADNVAAIEEAVTDILRVFGRATRSHEFCEQIKITVPQPDKITITELSSMTVVSGDPSAFTDVLGFAPVYPEHVLWPDFFKNVGSGVNFAWIKELIKAIASIRDGTIQQPIQALHLNTKTRLRFRAVLHRVERSPRKIECYVLFVQDVGGGHFSDLLPDYAKILLPTMRLAYRMRYDLLDVYSGEKLSAKNEFAAAEGVALRVRIANVLDDILAESRSRSASPAQQVIDAFGGNSEHEREAREIINLMSRRWPIHARAIWEAIGYDSDRGYWVKDRETRLTDGEINQLGDALKHVDQMNGVFLRLGTARLVEKAAHDFPDKLYNVAEFAGYAKIASSPDVSALVARDECSGRTSDPGAASDLRAKDRL